MNLEQAREYIERKIAILRPKLAEAIGEDFELFNSGSIQTGLYYGPKLAMYSSNPDCPFPRIVEADLMLILSNTHPYDKNILNKIRSVIGCYEFQNRESVHWDKTDVPYSRSFWYEELDESTGFEWDFSIYQQPHNDIALYWEFLFSNDEIEWQKNIRHLITSAHIPLNDFKAIKKPQTFEARWRLVASHALWKLAEEGRLENTPDMPVKGIAKPPVDFLVNKWIEGASGYRTMERPQVFISDEALQLLKKKYEGEVFITALAMPHQPEWVAYADRVQKELKANHQLGANQNLLLPHNPTYG